MCIFYTDNKKLWNFLNNYLIFYYEGKKWGIPILYSNSCFTVKKILIFNFKLIITLLTYTGCPKINVTNFNSAFYLQSKS